jgi:hypothetical protein
VSSLPLSIDSLTEREIAKAIETSGRWLAGASPRPLVGERQLAIEVAQS